MGRSKTALFWLTKQTACKEDEQVQSNENDLYALWMKKKLLELITSTYIQKRTQHY